jgi:uncharacterized protein (DUF1697 family)
MSSHVALLRGINVGGCHVLPMKDLAGLFVAAGCREVQTYIQSGNVVFGATAAVARKVPALVAAAIQERFGFESPVVVRTAAELLAVVRDNPYQHGTDLLSVLFLAEAPSGAQVASLDPQRSAPDSFVVKGREVYLHTPRGLGRTKLTNAYFDSKLGTVSTGRNWRTVLKLVEMTG